MCSIIAAAGIDDGSSEAEGYMGGGDVESGYTTEALRKKSAQSMLGSEWSGTVWRVESGLQGLLRLLTSAQELSCILPALRLCAAAECAAASMAGSVAEGEERMFVFTAIATAMRSRNGIPMRGSRGVRPRPARRSCELRRPRFCTTADSRPSLRKFCARRL